jgi:putative acetyltransferase
MKEIKKEERDETLIKELLNVWENSVRVTHKFLSNEEIEKIKEFVPQALSGISHLIVETDENKIPIAFMGIEKQKLEMLFITSECRGMGIGKKMLLHGIENYGVKNLAVNEDNPQAKGFYEHMGFKVYQRNELDDQGKPYPVLYMRLEK